MILLIDNYDSFVFNLARYLRQLGQETVVVRNDAIDADGVCRLDPEAIVLSPGPCTPREAGNSLPIVQHLHTRFPLLGVCLGHQTIAAALGGRIVRAPEPMHGRTSTIVHNGDGVFHQLPNPLTAGRYHSLVVDPDSVSDRLQITARTPDQVVMALRHRDLPVAGVQFHPESILTDGGYRLLWNFLKLAGVGKLIDPEQLPSIQPERSEPATPIHLKRRRPDMPVTF